ncbi:piRNA biogenesis protein EXD1 [Collichthys lucidus]|uniref:PiRNA biogenesis protein EXD1 n=1 Tax=Collichthys lucidus TaxID=240159 RepID=A0A4U5VFN0_COLLU|nr:piRNA biogenesis protein EXD1 [Collichthys lucidus]
MDWEDVEFLNFIKGKRIKLTLKTSSYLGVVQRFNPNKTLILADVCGSNGCRYPGSKMFFGHEILNVELINDANTDSGNAADCSLEEHLNVTSDDDEDEEVYINFVVIDEFHEKFGPAVMHIKNQHVIGVGADGVELFQNGRLCWLQIATKNKVYLFDILVLGARAFKNGLSMILQNKHILKVADVMCFYSETGGFLPDRVSTLQDVVSLHLKVPSSQLLSLQLKSQLTREKGEMWQKRPCPVPLVKVMALSVIHLLPLRLVLLDTLMGDYMALVDSYLTSGHYEPDEIQHITMESVSELPRQLRQLEQMRSERQEWAAALYPVTEQGLLDRFNPRPQSQRQTSPAVLEHSQTQAESFEPASSTQADRPLHEQPTSPPRDAHASLDSASQPPVPAAVSDFREEVSVDSPPSLSVGRGRTEMDTMGRGRSFESLSLSLSQSFRCFRY